MRRQDCTPIVSLFDDPNTWDTAVLETWANAWLGATQHQQIRNLCGTRLHNWDSQPSSAAPETWKATSIGTSSYHESHGFSSALLACSINDPRSLSWMMHCTLCTAVTTTTMACVIISRALRTTWLRCCFGPVSRRGLPCSTSVLLQTIGCIYLSSIT